jgi:formylglycine-generating enzyme required for sulfatase activity
VWTDPTGPITGSKRVIRGGGFDAEAQDVRSARRYSGNTSDSSSTLGFRCARAVE